MRDLLDLKKIPDTGPKPDGSQDGQSMQSESEAAMLQATDVARAPITCLIRYSVAQASEPPGDVTARNPKLEQRP
jgi:hypothetical protein